MDKHVNDKLGRDEVERLIVDRLGSRQEKIYRIKEWEKGNRRSLRTLYAVISAAACLAIFFVTTDLFKSGNIIDELGIAAPCMDAYRSAVPELVEIEQLVSSGKYYEALDATYAALRRSDKAVKELQKHPRIGDEEWEYEYQSEKMLNSELRWKYIYLLVLAECDRSAIKELKKYLRDTDFCQHKEEAESMLRALD